MPTFSVSFNLNYFGTKQDLHYDSHIIDREKVTDWSSGLGGKGFSHHTKGWEYCASSRIILKTGMVLVLLQCYSLEMLAECQIIKLLMKFKTYNNAGTNIVKFELSQFAGGRVNWHSPFRKHLGNTQQSS